MVSKIFCLAFSQTVPMFHPEKPQPQTWDGRRIHDGRLVVPPWTNNCCQVQWSRTRPWSGPPPDPLPPSLPSFVSVSDLDQQCQSPASGKGGRTTVRDAAAPPNSNHFHPLSPRPAHRFRRFLFFLAAGGRHPGCLCREKGMLLFILPMDTFSSSSPFSNL